MKQPQLYEGLIERSARKIASAFPKQEKKECESIVKRLIESLREKVMNQSYRVDVDKKYAWLDSRGYRVALDDGISKIRSYANSQAVQENPKKMFSFLQENLDLIFTGEFGLEAKVGGFEKMNEDDLRKYILDLAKKHRLPEHIERKRAETRERRFEVIEEVVEKLHRSTNNPYRGRPIHPSQDSP
jgi:hypothetical protein